MKHSLHRPLKKSCETTVSRSVRALLFVLLTGLAVFRPAVAQVVNETGAPLPDTFQAYADSLFSYYTAGVSQGSFNAGNLQSTADLYSENVEIDLISVNNCLKNKLKKVEEAYGTAGRGYETSFVVVKVTQINDSTQLVKYTHSHTGSGAEGAFDLGEPKATYFTSDGLLGHKILTDGNDPHCWESNTRRDAKASERYNTAQNQTSAPNQKTADNQAQADEPIKSTGNNRWDLITTDDPSILECVVSHGRGQGEIFDKRVDQAVTHPDAFLFTAYYRDGTKVAIRLHPEFGSSNAAIEEVQRYTLRIGQLPSILRAGISRLAVMKGNKTAMGDGGGEGIHIQSGNAQLRESNRRLEETLFHEAVHTSLDDKHAQSPEWLEAQQRDGLFLTTYGRKKPAREDFAESLLYGYALLHHPERIPADYRQQIEDRIPNRLDYIKKLLPPDKPIFTHTVSAAKACQAS